jgi:uncharacterized protein (DUF58 family)
MSTRSLPLVYPTRIFGALLFVLAVMWYAAASQNNAASYLLLFATLGVVLVAIPRTALSLNGITATAESIKPVFAGQEVAVVVEVVNESRRSGHGIVVTLPERECEAEVLDEVAPGNATRVTLRFTASHRGEYEITQVQLASVYPLGFLSTRKRVPTRQSYVVYPAPAGDSQLPRFNRARSDAGLQQAFGEGDDFAGVRAYVPGESQRHIDWKAVARGQPMMTKQFSTERDDELELDFERAPGNTEARLAQLALWVVEAERAHRRYALSLPGTTISAASGEAHYHRCLRALALHE